MHVDPGLVRLTAESGHFLSSTNLCQSTLLNCRLTFQLFIHSTFSFNKSATNAVIRTLLGLQPTFVGGARTLAHTSRPNFFNRADWCSKEKPPGFLAVRAHYPITRIKSAVGPTANTSCIVYGGLGSFLDKLIPARLRPFWLSMVIESYATESWIYPSSCRVNSGQSDLHDVGLPCDRPTAHVELTRVDSTSGKMACPNLKRSRN